MRLPTDGEWKAFVEALLRNEEFMAVAHELNLFKRRRK